MAVGSRVGFKTSHCGLERQLMNVTYERKKSPGGQEHSTTDRLTVQQARERARMRTSLSPMNETATLTSAAHEEKVITVLEETSSLVPIQGTEDRGKLASTSYKRVSQAKKNMVKEESDKNTAELFTSNQQSPIISAEEFTPEMEKDGVQIHEISDKVIFRELPVASSPQKVLSVVTPKNDRYMLSPYRSQKMKLNSERTKSSSLPEISGAILQTSRGRAKTQEALHCHSREILPKKTRGMTVYQRAENVPNSTEVLSSAEKYRSARLASDKLSGKYVTLTAKTQKSTLNLIERDIQHKGADTLAKTTDVKFRGNPQITPNKTQEAETGIDQCPIKISGKEFHFKNEIKPVIPQRLPKSRIPETLHEKSSQEIYESSKKSEVSVLSNKTLQITGKIATSQACKERNSQNSPKNGTFNHSTKEETIQSSSKKDFVQNSVNAEAINIHGNKESLFNDQNVEKLYNSVSQRKLSNDHGKGKLQKSKSVEKLHHSINLGKLQSPPDKKCYMKNCTSQASLEIKQKVRHSKIPIYSPKQIQITQKVAVTKLPIQSKKSTIDIMQNIPEKGTSHSLPKIRISTSRRIPVSVELLGRSSLTRPGKLSHHLHDNVSQNKEIPEVLENSLITQAVDKDLQEVMLQNVMSQDPKDNSIIQNTVNKSITDETLLLQK